MSHTYCLSGRLSTPEAFTPGTIRATLHQKTSKQRSSAATAFLILRAADKSNAQHHAAKTNKKHFTAQTFYTAPEFFYTAHRTF